MARRATGRLPFGIFRQRTVAIMATNEIHNMTSRSKLCGFVLAIRLFCKFGHVQISCD